MRKYQIFSAIITMMSLLQPAMAGLTYHLMTQSEPSTRQVMSYHANTLVRQDQANAIRRYNEIAQRAMARIASGQRITRADDDPLADAVRRRIAVGVRLESQREGLDRDAQRRLLNMLADDTRIGLRIAKRQGDTHAIHGQTILLRYFESRLHEIRESEERDKARNQQVRLMGMYHNALRDLSLRLLNTTLTPAERVRLQEVHDRVSESLPRQPLPNRVQMNRVLEELKDRAALRNISVVVPLDNSHMAHIIRLAMQS